MWCSYLFYFLFIISRIKHRAQVGEVEDGQEAENQVQQHHPILLQTVGRGKLSISYKNIFIMSLNLSITSNGVSATLQLAATVKIST